MPSQEHELILELFRNRPVLAVELLEEVFKEKPPAYRVVRADSENLTEIIPRELNADLVVLVEDEQAVLSIVVEAQLNWDADKEFVWPTYVCGARMRHRCDACLLIVAPNAALARRLSMPIRLGPGRSWVTPLVLGPEGIPVITDVHEAKERPELAVLSALAHGETDAAVPVALAALEAVAGLDSDKQSVYADAVLASLGVAARLALEAQMSIPNYEYRSDFAKTYYKQGKDEGRNEGRNEALAQLFERRLGRPLTVKERETLERKLKTEGATIVGDVVLDSSREELEVWLTGTASR